MKSLSRLLEIKVCTEVLVAVGLGVTEDQRELNPKYFYKVLKESEKAEGYYTLGCKYTH